MWNNISKNGTKLYMELFKDNENSSLVKCIFFVFIFSSTLFFDSKFGFNGLVPIGITFSLLLSIFSGVVRVRLIDCAVVFLLLILSLITLVLTYEYWKSDSVQIKNYLLLVLGMTSYLFIKSIIKELNNNEISSIINYILIFHFSVLFLQLIIFYLTKYDLNIGLFFGGEGHRAFATGGIYRPTGIFDEPAIYSMFCSGLLLMRLLYNRHFDWIILLGFLSIFLTLSFVGFILAGFMLLAYSSIKIKIIFVGIFIFLLIVLYSPLFYDNYIVNRIDLLFTGSDSSTNKKFFVIFDWLENQELFNFGYGYIGLRDWTPNYYDAVYDLTFYITLFTQFGFYLGVFYMIWFISAIFFANRSFSDISAFLILLIKLTATHFPFLWIVFAFFFNNNFNYKLSDK